MSCLTPVPLESMGNVLGVFRRLSSSLTENGDNSIPPASLCPALKDEGAPSLLCSRLASSPICCSVTLLKHTVPASRANYGAICLYLSTTKAQYKLGSADPVIFCREIKWSYVESSQLSQTSPPLFCKTEGRMQILAWQSYELGKHDGWRVWWKDSMTQIAQEYKEAIVLSMSVPNNHLKVNSINKDRIFSL